MAAPCVSGTTLQVSEGASHCVRGAGAWGDFSPVGVEWRYHGMLPKSGHRSLSITNGWPIVVFVWNYQCRGVRVGSRAPCAFENIGVTMFCLLCFPEDKWQHVPTTVVGLLSFPECVATSTSAQATRIFTVIAPPTSSDIIPYF